MLVSQVEVQKKVKSQERSPILAAPAGRGPGPAPASGEAVSRAMHDELARSMAELRLDTLPKPYFIAYRVDEIERAGAAATLGSLLHSDGGRAPPAPGAGRPRHESKNNINSTEPSSLRPTQQRSVAITV